MLEEFLPVHDFNEVHRISCSDPPEVVMSSARDHVARLKFGRYWRLIRPASGAIRVAWLRAIRRQAERAHAQRLAGAAGSG